jgi:hypothetical protein
MMSVTGMVTSYVEGFVRDEVHLAEQCRRLGLTVEQLMVRNAPYVSGLMKTGRYPLVERVIIEAEQPHMEPDRRFAYGLERILDGIEGSLPPQATA